MDFQVQVQVTSKSRSLAAQYEYDVLGVRRCLHSSPGRGYVRKGPAAFGLMPACFEHTEVEFKFKMGIKATVCWKTTCQMKLNF